MLPSPEKYEIDLYFISRDVEIRQMLLAKELPGNNREKSMLFRSAMLKIGRLLISLGNKIEAHFLAETSRRPLDITAR